MMRQYPHYLFAKEIAVEAHQNEKGNWVKEQYENVYIGKCREQASGRGSELQIAGGNYLQFSSVVHLPKGTKRINEGTEVFITNDCKGLDLRLSGAVLKFDEGQLHSRLWV